MDSSRGLVVGQRVSHRIFLGPFRVAEVNTSGGMVKIEGLCQNLNTGQYEPDGLVMLAFSEDLENEEDVV